MNPLDKARKEISDLILTMDRIDKKSYDKLRKIVTKTIALIKIHEPNHPLAKEK